MSKWTYTNNDGKHIINNERLHKELEACVILIEQQANSMNRLQQLTEAPPYCGTPLDLDWPNYHTHWMPIVVPENVG
ncbi:MULTISPECIES: hypothetical protein [Paenibacillus]|uniref:hypothetical protein n=1 Tax=Paenibacillus TaxID=44249 RepID=UPI000B8A3EAD|nr:hypothetical protein [Paenibacillus amylolyticus]